MDMIEKVREFGAEWALRMPNVENPLSGEYADDLTPASMLERAGVSLDEHEDWDLVETLCDAFEDAYWDAQRN